MKNIKILVAYHKPAYLLKNDVFVPIHLGRTLAKEAVQDGQMNPEDYQWLTDNMIGDDSGDNISRYNPYFNELTAIYWAWKNYDKLGNPDYIGFCHYRRHFIFDDASKYPSWANDVDVIPDDYLKKYKILDTDDIPNYDYIVDTPCAYYETVYQQYQSNHNIEDLDYVLDLVKKKYPKLTSLAKTYMHDKNIYFANMFVMKKEIFFDYCEYIFSILFDFFKTDYYINRDPVSARMFVSERLTGIYIKYLQTKDLKYKEYPITYLLNTDIPRELKPISEDVPAIVLTLDNAYMPVFSVFLQSLIDHASVDKKYDICVTDDKISYENKKILTAMCPKNISLRFIPVAPYLKGVDVKAFSLYTYYTMATYYRFFITDIFKNYDKVIYMDADAVLTQDVAQLYDIDLQDNWVAATRDLYMPLWLKIDKKMKSYMNDTLCLKKPENYFQAGVMMFNIKKLKQISFLRKLMDKLSEIKNPICLDQDIFNAVCQEHVYFLDNRWNFDRNLIRFQQERPTLFTKMTDENRQIFQRIKNDPYFIHYAGPEKPWKLPEISFGNRWWTYARKTPFYEVILYRNTQSSPDVDVPFLNDCLHRTKNQMRYIKYKLLSKLTWGKAHKHYKKKKKEQKAYLKKIKKALKG